MLLTEKILETLDPNYSIETTILSLALNEPVAIVRACLKELESKGLIVHHTKIADFILWENWIKC